MQLHTVRAMLEELASDHVSAEHAPGVLAERRKLPKVPARDGLARTPGPCAKVCPGPARMPCPTRKRDELTACTIRISLNRPIDYGDIIPPLSSCLRDYRGICFPAMHMHPKKEEKSWCKLGHVETLPLTSCNQSLGAPCKCIWSLQL